MYYRIEAPAASNLNGKTFSTLGEVEKAFENENDFERKHPMDHSYNVVKVEEEEVFYLATKEQILESLNS